MGESMARANTVAVARQASVGAYEVHEKNSDLYQNAYKLEYVIGSGVNGQTFLVRRGSALVEAPLTFYSRPGKWDLSPGYRETDAGFNRTVQEGCLACHSASSRIDPGELAIGCENCHGGGKAHVAQPSKINIINPARLQKRLADDICMYCHQGGDARVLQPGKSYGDFRPGDPLNQTLAIFKLPTKTAGAPLEHHAAMRLSKCYRASQGRMNCLTCHDPHREVNYNQTCQQCHAALPHPPGGGADCVTCHMPKREVTTISHAALTDHRILSRPGENVPLDTSSLCFNCELSRLPDLVKLAAYGELNLQKDYLEVLERLARSMPNDSLVRASLGRRALLSGKPAEAVEYLRDASTMPSLLDLAQALKLSGRQTESIPILERAALLEPLHTAARKTLVLAYIEKKDYTAAKAAMKQYVADFPEDTFMRGLLAKVSSP